MFVKYGASFLEAKGEIYSWLSSLTNEKFVFIGVFIWLASWVIWLVSSIEVVGMLILVVTFAASRGIDKIAKVASIGGIVAFAISILFSLLSIFVLIQGL